MPELPEIETLRRGLERKIVGKRIIGVTVREERLRFPVDAQKLLAHACHQSIREVQRRAKYLILVLENNSAIVIHLGMSGRLLCVPNDAPLEKHEHVLFDLGEKWALRFRDHRRFGLVDAVRLESIHDYRFFMRLGCEPLSAEFTEDFLYEAGRGLKKPVKNFLMDSSKIVGVGNIYASEALFQAGIRPQKSIGRLSRAACARLVKAVKSILQEAIDHGGTSFSDFYDCEGKRGGFQLELRVYQRGGKPCVNCGQKIRRFVMAGRSTFACSRCQS